MDFAQVFTLVTGLVYIFLEIKQSNWMWVVGVLTGAAAIVVFVRGGLYASACLNAYYVAMSIWGLHAWRRDSRAMGSEGIHLKRLTPGVAALSAVLMAVLTWGAVRLLSILGDPMSTLDASVAVLSAIATWWLSRSYAEQWLLWIVADGMSAALCISQSLPWMTALYVFYTLSAVYGFVHWHRKGGYVS